MARESTYSKIQKALSESEKARGGKSARLATTTKEASKTVLLMEMYQKPSGHWGMRRRWKRG